MRTLRHDRYSRALPVVLIALTLFTSGCAVPFGNTAAASSPRTRVHRHVHVRGHGHRVTRSTHSHTYRTHKHRHHKSAVSIYAAQIVGDLNTSARLFDLAAGDATRNTGLCAKYSDRINLLSARIDGVPHPYAWYSSTGRLHHRVMGVFHTMLGNMQNCQTAVDNGDSGSASAAVGQMDSTAHSMHEMVNEARSLAGRR